MSVVISRQITTSKSSEPGFGGISEDSPMIKRYVGPVKFDPGIQSSNVDHFPHSRRIDRERCCRIIVVIRLERRRHFLSAPEIGYLEEMVI